MALNQLSEKLDQLDAYELGIEFDEMATWSKLEQRLDQRKAIVYRWFAAACVLIGLVLLPISVLKERTVQVDMVADQVELPVETEPTQPIVNEVTELSKPTKKLNTIERKGLEPIQLAEISTVQLALEPVPVQKIIKQKAVFAAKDISMIQASLGRPSIEKEQKITVRAQLSTSTQPIQFKNQVLKIKLFEVGNN